MFNSKLDLSCLDKWSRLEVYIKVDQSEYVRDKERKEEALLGIMKAFGTDFSNTYTSKEVRKYIADNMQVEEDADVTESHPS